MPQPEYKTGLLVVRLVQSGPASLAGIREGNKQVRIGNGVLSVGGDVILAIQGKSVSSFQELATEVDKFKPGEKITVTVLRSNQKVDIPVTLQEAPRQQ
jgi:S1-C subfamily serine protease